MQDARSRRASRRSHDHTKHACADAYRESASKVKAHDNEGMMKKAIKDCTS
jgi:hypothetical protein